MRYLKYTFMITIILLILSSPFVYKYTNELLKEYTAYAIVPSNKKIKELENKTIMDIISHQTDEIYYILTKDSYFYTIDANKLKVKSKIHIPNLNNPQKIQIISNNIEYSNILVLEKNNSNYNIVNFIYYYGKDKNKNSKYPKGKLSKGFSKKIDSLKPIFIWDSIYLVDSKLDFYDYKHNTIEKNIHTLPFKNLNSIDFTFSADYSKNRYTLTDRSKKEVSIYYKAYDNKYKKYYYSKFKLKKAPQSADFSAFLTSAEYYFMNHRTNYWGNLLVSYKDQKGVKIYSIVNDKRTKSIRNINKFYSSILSSPFILLDKIYKHQ